MNDQSFEDVLAVRQSAHHHLLALALAAAHRNVPSPATTLKAMGPALVQDWAAGAGSHAPDAETRNRVTSAYAEEVSAVIDLAVGLVKRMPAD